MDIPILNKFLKKGKSAEEDYEIQGAAGVTLQDIIAPPSIEIKQNYLKLGETLCRTFFVFSYPRYLSTGWLSPAINLNHVLDISLHIHPVSTGAILRKLRKKLTETQAEILEREDKGLIRDPVLEAAYHDIEELRDKLQTARERMFRLGVYITIYARTEEELEKIENRLRSIFESRLIYLKPCLLRQKQGFDSTAPYGMDKILTHTPMNTAPMSSIFPFVSPDLSANEGILYGINQHNDSLVLFDRFTLPNANMVVFASSGAGKSINKNEKVLCKTNKRISLQKIGPLVDNILQKQGIDFRDKELEGKTLPGLKVWTFDKNMKGKWGEVKIAARKKAPQTFYKFRTQSGREITTTGDHNLVVLQNGTLKLRRGSQIEKGEYIPLPREVASNQGPQKYINLLKLLKDSKGIYVKGAQGIIRKHSEGLKGANINTELDKYLYKYKVNRNIPIRYFWQIANKLKLNTHEYISSLSLVSHQNKGELPALLKINNELMRIMGYIVSEGTIGRKKNFIKISNLDKEFLNDAEYCLKKNHILHFRTKKGIDIASTTAVMFLKKIGVEGGSKNKKVPPLVFALDKNKIANFLRAYFEGDGSVENHGLTISAVSKSKRLISEISYLLFYFGIIARIQKTKKRPLNCNWKKKKTYWRLVISGQGNLSKFAEYINFISNRKKKDLAKILKKNRNTNVDVIPGVQEILKEIYQLFGCQLHGIKNLSNLRQGRFNPSPEALKQIIAEVKQRIDYFKNKEATYKVLSTLPSLSEIIKLGESDPELNRKLWEVLGQSWRVVKNEGVQPGCINTLKMLRVVRGDKYGMSTIKSALHSGFKEMDIPIKHYNKSIQSALKTRPKSSTQYKMMQTAAQYIWQNYQNTLKNKIPQVEQKLEQLKILANSDLCWDPIVEVKKIENKTEEYVYDLTCENGVFLAGEGGMFVHNSYFCKLEILRYLMQGVDAIIIDPENEYKALAEAVGGGYANISLSSGNHLNPFDLPQPREGEDPANVLRSNVINLVGLMRIMLGGLTPQEDSLVDKALTETYRAKDITEDSDPTTWPDKIPLLSDFQVVLQGMEGTESLVDRLQRFTSGSYEQFFNHKTNVEFGKRLTVFGVRDMEDELRPMALYIILRFIWNQVRSELKKRILLIDEAWWIMKSEDGASFLYGIVKRGRKYWLGVSTITQDVDDFMKSVYGKPIITNASLQFLLKQSPASIETVQEAFNLTEEEKYLLLECNVGEGVFIAGRKRVALKVVASYAEDQIITTAPEEVQKAKKAKQELKGK